MSSLADSASAPVGAADSTWPPRQVALLLTAIRKESRALCCRRKWNMGGPPFALGVARAAQPPRDAEFVACIVGRRAVLAKNGPRAPGCTVMLLNSESGAVLSTRVTEARDASVVNDETPVRPDDTELTPLAGTTLAGRPHSAKTTCQCPTYRLKKVLLPQWYPVPAELKCPTPELLQKCVELERVDAHHMAFQHVDANPVHVLEHVHLDRTNNAGMMIVLCHHGRGCKQQASCWKRSVLNGTAFVSAKYRRQMEVTNGLSSPVPWKSAWVRTAVYRPSVMLTIVPPLFCIPYCQPALLFYRSTVDLVPC